MATSSNVPDEVERGDKLIKSREPMPNGQTELHAKSILHVSVLTRDKNDRKCVPIREIFDRNWKCCAQ